MSDSFQMLVDADATADEAAAVARRVLTRFRKLGLIAGRATSACVLGGTGYRPGPAIATSFRLPKGYHPFWELRTCGVEPTVGRSCNLWAVGPVCEGFTCPACAAAIEPFLEPFIDGLLQAVGEWENESGPALVRCPECQKERAVTEWECAPPLGFGNVSFRFWNWPALNSPGWQIDIACVVREVTGHTIIQTHGHI